MMPPEIQARIDRLYADMKPLMDEFGIEPQTIEQRYQRIQQRKELEQKVKLRPKPRWKL
jgi:DNA repair ATPase RecN